ncbi:MAG TPA: efflux RND transporter periplasmic adaptor subunit [Xanthobacteraceae bacterium]|nr:efflux RND transporter periplasmic adaptor subunit [Xanthobacteraceae bacterium]
MKPALKWLAVAGSLVACLVAVAAVPGARERVASVLGSGEAAEASVPAARDNGPLPPTVTIVHAETRDFTERLFVSGTLVPREEALVGAQIDGLRIVEVLAEDGDRVEKGQVLARLDRSQLDTLLAQNDAAHARAQAAVAQARSQIEQVEAMYAQAAADLARARKLDLAIVTQATLDQRTAAARSAEAQVGAARSALAVAEAEQASREAERRELMVRVGRTDVKAPVAGIISRRTARLGALAMGAGDPLFRIIADGAVDLDAEVPEDSLARLAVGMPAKIILPGFAHAVTGKVRLLNSEVDKTTRLGRVRVALPDEARARIGSFASGTIEIAHRRAVGLPATALTRTDGRSVVQVVKDGRVEDRPVAVGTTEGLFVELQSGIAAGEVVIARAAPFLRQGDEVRAVRPSSAQPVGPASAQQDAVR